MKNVTVNQLHILTLLSDSGPMSFPAIERAASQPWNHIIANVDALRRAGYLSVLSDEKAHISAIGRQCVKESRSGR